MLSFTDLVIFVGRDIFLPLMTGCCIGGIFQTLFEKFVIIPVWALFTLHGSLKFTFSNKIKNV